MKTEDLIAALAADTVPQRAIARQLALPFAATVALSVTVFALLWGVRPDLKAALASLAMFKTLVPLVLVWLAMAAALALAHPGAATFTRLTMLGGFIGMAALAFLMAFAHGGIEGLRQALPLDAMRNCTMSIIALAMPALAILFVGLSKGAAVKPRLAGAIAGLAAGGLAAAIYSLYCDKDMMLFAMPAYSLAIAVVALVGATLGPKLMRW